MSGGSGKTDGIAIVGIGCRFSKADDLQAFWRMTLEGQDGFSEIPADRWDHEAFFDPNPRSRDKSTAPRGGFIDDVSSFPAVALQVPPRRVEVMDPQQRLSLECSLQAVEDSGRNPSDLPRRTGVYMGVTAMEYRTLSSARIVAQLMATGKLGEAPTDPETLDALAGAVERVLPTRPFSAPGLLSNMVAGAVAQELRLHGPAFTSDAACSSALVALNTAIEALRSGSIDAALTGGVYLCFSPEHHIAFSRIGAMSRSGHCRPFDARADGFIQGDGCGVVLLKRVEDARRDGDRIYAVIQGVGINNDGGSTGPMAPVKSGQVEVVRMAWEDAKRRGADPTNLGYIECHGTGTSVGDRIEFEGLTESIGSESLGGESGRAALGSAKANFGHTMSAAGITGLIRAAMAVYHKQIPPLAHFESAKDDLKVDGSSFYFPTAPEAWDAKTRTAGVSAFGFGGTNVHLILSSEEPDLTPAAQADQAELLLMSAGDEATLRDLARRTAATIAADPTATVAGLARLWSARRQQPVRLALVANTKAELVATLTAIGAGEYPEGVAIGTFDEDDAPKVAFLYPGQGAQRVGMLQGIRDRFDVVARALTEMDQAVDGVMDTSISDLLYPALSPDAVKGTPEHDAASAELTETKNCQPALLAVGVALTRLLDQVGVTPAVVAGHSVGEFTAATIGGVTSPADGIRWVARRGAAMSAMSGDTGAMAAIMAPAKDVEALLTGDAVIANINHPKQLVISGSTGAVAATVKAAEAADLKAVPLRVSHGFHSSVFGDLDLSAVIDQIPMADPTTPVASCIQDHPYADKAEAKQVYKDHATSPVVFTDTIAQCEDLGVDIYLQVGAGGPLVSFARGSLPAKRANILTLASKHDDDGGASLLLALGQLWVRGVDVDIAKITASAAIPSVPPVVLPRENYWIISNRPQRRATLSSGSASATALSDAAANHGAANDGRGGDTAAIAAAASADSADVASKVLAAVANASAYPLAALKPKMRLGDDLGFDSMMVADLAEELGKVIAGFKGIPQEILINAPTIADIIAFAENPVYADEEAIDDDAPLSAWTPTWRTAALPTSDATALNAGTFAALGSGLDAIVRTLQSKGFTKVDGPVADLILFGCNGTIAAPVNAVLAGEALPKDQSGDLIAALDSVAKAGKTADVVVIRKDGDAWAESLTGVIRCVAREWPDRVVKSVRNVGEHFVGGDIVVAELVSTDRSADIRYDGDVRFVAGNAAVAATDQALWTPSPCETVLITGGTRGIGRQLGERLAAAGAKVLLLGRSAPKDDAADTADTGFRANITFIQADVTDPASLAAAIAPHAPITALVHSAGVLADGPLGEVEPKQGQLARQIKGAGFVNAITACGPTLKVALGLGSWAGRFGNAYQAHYGAANALMAQIGADLPPSIRGVISEFGPWVDSEMVKTIPAAAQQQMRADGVDFVGTDAGLNALLADLRFGAGVRTHGRRIPATLRRGVVTTELSVASHPFLADHAVGQNAATGETGTPVLPLASAATMLAEAAGLSATVAPFEVRNLTLFKGVAVSEPLQVTASASGDRAELRQGDKNTLSYTARVSALVEVPEFDEALTGGDGPTLSLAEFYKDVTFHGPLLAGIVSIDGIGADFVRGRVRCGQPGDWIIDTEQTQWAIDPLAFDSAMQLTAYVAYTRFGRGGTPVSFDRVAVLKPWPAGQEVIVEARFGDGESDKFATDIVFRDVETGEVIAFAENVVAQMQAVSISDVAEDSDVAALTTDKADATPDAQTDDETPFEVKPEWVDPSKWKGYKDIAMRLEVVKVMGMQNPFFDLHEGTANNLSVIDGHEVINYSSYNYLGLSGDERILDRVNAAMRKYGTSVSASRVASGERPFHRQLEAALAKAQGVDDAVCMAGGHATNVNTIGHLFNPNDLILHDELIHDSCLQGIKLSGAQRRSFRHEDFEHLESQLKDLRRHYEKVLILIEGVYSMDGDVANLPKFLELKKKYGCMIMVDEAHSFGTIGKTGLGIGEHYRDLGFDIDRRDVDIWMGTMSKSLASMGGWIAGSKELITYLRYTTPGFVFAAGIPPTLGVAALASLEIWQEETWRVKKLQDNAKRFCELLKARGLDTDVAVGDSPVIPVIAGDSMTAMKLSEQLLLDHGINAKPIIFPAVANDAARLRFFVTTLHTDEQLVYTADRIAETLTALKAEKKS